jgi:hypothetical protein
MTPPTDGRARRRGGVGALRGIPATAVLGLLAAIVVASPAGADPDGGPEPVAGPRASTFSLLPADAHRPDKRDLISYGVTPGVRLTEHVAVTNDSDGPVTFRLSVRDADNRADGMVDLRRLPPTDTGMANWIKIKRSEVPVRPRSRAIVPFELAVPSNAQAGDYVGGIVAAPASAGDQGERAAVRVELRLSGPARAQLATDWVSTDYRGTLNPIGSGSVVVRFAVHNTGNARVTARTSMRLHGWYGGDVSLPGPQVPDLLPGSTVPLTVRVPRITQAVRSQAEITIVPLDAADPGRVPAGVTTRHRFWTVPWSLLGILLLAASGAVALSRSSRRHRLPTGSAPAFPEARMPAGVVPGEAGHRP